MIRKALYFLIPLLLISNSVFGSEISFTKESRFFSKVSSDSKISYESDYTNGLVLGELLDESVVTYSFAIPKPQISDSVFLSGMQIEIYGKSNGGISGSSGVEVVAGIPQTYWSSILTDSEGITSHNFSNPLSFVRSSGDNVTWYLDVTFSALDTFDYYDLKYIKVTFVYTGLSDGDFLRLSHAVNGISALNGLKQFHNEYIVNGDVVQKAVGSAFAGTCFDALMGAIASGVPVDLGFPTAYAELAGLVGSQYVVPKISSIAEFQDLEDTLDIVTWWIPVAPKANAVSGTIDGASEELVELGLEYISKLSDGVIEDQEFSDINSRIEDANNDIIIFYNTIHIFLDKMINEYNQSTAVADVVNGYFAGISAFLSYDYSLEPKQAPDRQDDQSYLVAYYTLLNQQKYTGTTTVTLNASQVQMEKFILMEKFLLNWVAAKYLMQFQTLDMMLING